MTALYICALVFIANLISYKDAAILLPATGALLAAAGLRAYLQHRGKRPLKKEKAHVKQPEPVSVRRVGNVLYASFPSTKEGREQAIKAFSEEQQNTPPQNDQPLQ